MKSGGRRTLERALAIARRRFVVTAKLMLLGMMVLMAAAPAMPQSTATANGASANNTDKETKPKRIIVTVNRRTTIYGTLISRDDELINFKDIKGEIHSYPVSRVIKVTELVEPKPGQTGVVFLLNGDTRSGVIIEDNYDYVLIEIEGIRANFSRDLVDRVVLEPTIEERYRSFKENLQPGQTLRHLTLCNWLVDNKKYEWAEKELEELLEYDESAEAKQLLIKVKAQLELQRGGFKTTPEQRVEEGNAGDDNNTKSGPVYAKDLLPQEILSNEDVNIIRVYELDFENPPRVAISADTIRTLIQSYGTSTLMPASQTGRTALFRADPINIVRLMFELKARELYPQIQVLTEPTSLNQFRQSVHDAWLINNCATSRCHGGLSGGRLFLHERNYKNERVRYTNLLILDRLELDEKYPLINYEDPMMSLIIQYGLPRQIARKPHPDVQGWKPVFTRGNTRMLDESIKWIQLMYQPRPEYPVVYDPPVIGQPLVSAPDPAATPPADQPTPTATDPENAPSLPPAFPDGEGETDDEGKPVDPDRPPRAS